MQNIIAKLKKANLPWYLLVKNGYLSKCTRKQTLAIFLEYFADLPKQGSIAWKNSRTGGANGPPVIGGSEITDVIKGSISGLISSKLGKSEFDGNIHTQLGNLFEEVSRQYFDYLYNTSTVETGSIPGLQDIHGNTIQSYSPDGINIIKINGQEMLNLMEFKCPSVRMPIDGEVPPQYKAQPKIGACTLGFIEHMMFVDAVFRRCSRQAFLPNNKYSYSATQMTKDNKAEFKDFSPLTMGVLYIYNTEPVEQSEPVAAVCAAAAQKDYTRQQITLDDFAKHARRVYTDFSINNIDEFWKYFDHLPEKPYKLMLNMLYTTYISEELNDSEKEALGHDLGSSENTKLFNEILKLAVKGQRSDEPGYKIYYDAGLLCDIYTADCNSYFNKQSRKFLNFTKANNYTPIGYIPWKLFKYVIVPMEVEPDFMDKHETVIRNTVNLIWEKKIQAQQEPERTEEPENVEQINLSLSPDFLADLVS